MINPEELAVKLLNSKKIKHSWKKDFKKDDYCGEKWDLINSDGAKIEVKSTGEERRFAFNSISPNISEQKNQIILKVLLEKEKIKKYKFVKFVKGTWVDITNSILKTH